MPATQHIPSREATVRDLAVELVDARRGHTIEFSNQPSCHSVEYDEQEAILAAVHGDYQVRGHDLPERPCLVLTENGRWIPGLVKQDTTMPGGDHAALIRCLGRTQWLRREQSGGQPDQWRYPD